MCYCHLFLYVFLSIIGSHYILDGIFYLHTISSWFFYILIKINWICTHIRDIVVVDKLCIIQCTAGVIFHVLSGSVVAFSFKFHINCVKTVYSLRIGKNPMVSLVLVLSENINFLEYLVTHTIKEMRIIMVNALNIVLCFKRHGSYLYLLYIFSPHQLCVQLRKIYYSLF